MTGTARFPGWTVVWVAFAVAVFAWGIGFYGPAVFLQTLHAAHGWPVATISAAITTHFVLGALIVIYLPEVHARLGLAVATAAGALLTALGVLAWANADAPWHLFLAAAVSGSGWAFTSGAAINAMVARWFDRDRPKALSHAFNGASIGGLVFTPLLVWLIGHVGFNLSALLVGAAMVVIVVPLAVRYLRYGPEHLGLPRDGVQGSPAQPVGPSRFSRAALMKDSRFITTSIAFALGLFAQVGLITHLLARLTPEFGSAQAAVAVSITTFSAVAGRYMLGWLIGDRDRRVAAAVNFATQSVGVLLLAFCSGRPLLILGCVLFGLGVGNMASLPALIVQREFPPEDVGTAVALVIAINQGVFALAPVVLGFLREASTNYALSFTFAATAQMIAAAFILSRRNAGLSSR